MRDIIPVNEFTDPVTVVENGDTAQESAWQPTAQALTNRTEYLNALIPKAYANFQCGGGSDPVLKKGVNISVSRVDSDTVRCTLIAPMSALEYAVIVSMEQDVNSAATKAVKVISKIAAHFDVIMYDTTAGTGVDNTGFYVNVVVYGDLA